MNEPRIRLLHPTPRRLIQLVRKDTHGYRDRHGLRAEKRQLLFRMETARRTPRVRQPEVGDVDEDVSSCKPLCLTVEDTCDERQTCRGVVKHPGGQAGG